MKARSSKLFNFKFGCNVQLIFKFHYLDCGEPFHYIKLMELNHLHHYAAEHEYHSDQTDIDWCIKSCREWFSLTKDE